MVGTGEEDVYQATKQLLQDHAAYTAMAHAENPYGDGKASQRIKEVLAQYYRLSEWQILRSNDPKTENGIEK